MSKKNNNGNKNLFLRNITVAARAQHIATYKIPANRLNTKYTEHLHQYDNIRLNTEILSKPDVKGFQVTQRCVKSLLVINVLWLLTLLKSSAVLEFQLKWNQLHFQMNLFVPWKHFCYLRRISLIACVFLTCSALSCFRCKDRHITGIFYMLFPVIAEIAAVLNCIWTQISWCRPIHTEQLLLHL